VGSKHESSPGQFVPKQHVESDHQDRFHKDLCENATQPMGHLHEAGEFGVQSTLLLIVK
jgi:hypothetical protein